MLCTSVLQLSPPGAQMPASPESSRPLIMERTESVMINLVCQPDWTTGAHLFAHILCRVCLWGRFWIRLTLMSVHWIRQIVLPKVGGPHLISWKPGSHRCWPPWRKKEFLLPDSFLTGKAAFSLTPDSSWNQLFLGSEPTGLWTETYSSPVLRPTDMAWTLSCQLVGVSGWLTCPALRQPLQPHKPEPYNKSLLPQSHTHTLSVLFLQWSPR